VSFEITWTDPQRAERHFRDLGEMATYFAMLENLVYALAGQVIGDPDVTAAVLPLPDVSRAVEVLRNIVAARAAASADLPAFTEALGEVRRRAEERNLLLHSLLIQGVSPGHEGHLFTIAVRRARIGRFPPGHIEECTARIRDTTSRLLTAAHRLNLMPQEVQAQTPGAAPRAP
jgi:hypothetical protein